MSERIVLRTGEALVEGAEDYLLPSPRSSSASSTGPVGHALANLIGDQVKGHTRVFAILNSDVQVRPGDRHGQQGHGQEQQVHEHPDGHRPGRHRQRRARRRPRRRHPQGQGQRPGDHLLGLARPRRAPRSTTSTTRPSSTSTARRPPRSSARRCGNEPTIDWLLENQDKVEHYFHQLGVEGKL